MLDVFWLFFKHLIQLFLPTSLTSEIMPIVVAQCAACTTQGPVCYYLASSDHVCTQHVLYFKFLHWIRPGFSNKKVSGFCIRCPKSAPTVRMLNFGSPERPHGSAYCLFFWRSTLEVPLHRLCHHLQQIVDGFSRFLPQRGLSRQLRPQS